MIGTQPSRFLNLFRFIPESPRITRPIIHCMQEGSVGSGELVTEK